MTIERLHLEFLQSAGICTDTRADVKDSLFVALKGDHFDGNSYVPMALQQGCRLAITEREDLAGDPRVVVVPSALETLQKLARFHRMKVAPRVLAITGSNGKTTTKELVTAVLGRKYSVLATRGNLNNHIGVPLTLLSLTREEVAVVEMGANHPGEIARLCEIAAPGAGLITNVGKAHLEGFGSLEGVLEAKAELYDYLSAHGGSAIIDSSDALLILKAEETHVNVVTVGPDSKLPVRCRITGQTPYLEVELQLGRKAYPVYTRLVGAYNLQNILLAAGVGLHYGVPEHEIAHALSHHEPMNNRSQFVEGVRNRVIVDAYNANPSSMREAIEGLKAYAKPPLMLILGEMAELGSTSEAEHQALVRWVMTLPVAKILLMGSMFHKVTRNLGLIDGKSGPSGEPSSRLNVFKGRSELEAFLESEQPAGYQILVKGSRVNELERILPLL
jgi:UDP-N-acetylmuramoyl-tripeptide--D-alanyl-D-alanine ligase